MEPLAEEGRGLKSTIQFCSKGSKFLLYLQLAPENKVRIEIIPNNFVPFPGQFWKASGKPE
jgi:hypothetical protein